MRFHVARSCHMRMVLCCIIALVFFSSMCFSVAADSEYGKEVKFRGVAVTDEEWGETVAYGSYYCEVAIQEILYDPKNALVLGDNVTIAYSGSLSLKIGDEVECYGLDCRNDTSSPKQCYGYVVCKNDLFYAIPEFQSSTAVFLFMAATLLMVIAYRRKYLQ